MLYQRGKINDFVIYVYLHINQTKYKLNYLFIYFSFPLMYICFITGFFFGITVVARGLMASEFLSIKRWWYHPLEQERQNELSTQGELEGGGDLGMSMNTFFPEWEFVIISNNKLPVWFICHRRRCRTYHLCKSSQAYCEMFELTVH